MNAGDQRRAAAQVRGQLDRASARRRRRHRRGPCALCARVEAATDAELLTVIRGAAEGVARGDPLPPNPPGWPEDHARGCPAAEAGDDLSDDDVARLLELALADDPPAPPTEGERS